MNQSISILMAIYWPFLVRAFSVGFVRRIASFGTDFAFTCFLVAFLQRLTNARWYISLIYFSESRHADGILTFLLYSLNFGDSRLVFKTLIEEYGCCL